MLLSFIVFIIVIHDLVLFTDGRSHLKVLIYSFLAKPNEK